MRVDTAARFRFFSFEMRSLFFSSREEEGAKWSFTLAKSQANRRPPTAHPSIHLYRIIIHNRPPSSSLVAVRHCILPSLVERGRKERPRSQARHPSHPIGEDKAATRHRFSRPGWAPAA